MTKLPSTAVGRSRLLKLADLLEKDAKNKKGVKFDLAIWGRTREGRRPKVSCGTTACAMGLAVISGAFKEEGLENGSYSSSQIVPKLGASDGIQAAVKLFAIESDEAAFLFYDDSYRGATSGAAAERKVAKRIRDFVAGKAMP